MSQLSREDLLASINLEIDTVIDEINSVEKIRLLGGIGAFVTGGIEFAEDTYPDIIETSIEYAESIAVASSNNFRAPLPDSEKTTRIFSLLKQIQEKYVDYYATENNVTKYSQIEQRLRAKVIKKTLTARGEGYPIHVEEVFIELFSSHDPFFLKHYGFTVETILDIIDYLDAVVRKNQRLVKMEHLLFLKWLRNSNKKELAQKYGVGDPFMPSQAYQIETRRTPPFRSVSDLFKFEESKINDEQRKILQTLSLQFGDNAEYVNPKFKALPLNSSLVKRRPILYDTVSKSFFCFSTKLVHRNLFNIAEGLIEDADADYYNKNYGGKKQYSKSTYFEEKAAELLQSITPISPIYTNLKYGVDDELDILIDSPNCTYLIEVKSGGISDQAKRGAIDRLKLNLKSLVGSATSQASRAEDYIQQSMQASFRNHHKHVVVTVDKAKPILKIIVSFAAITGVSNQLADLAKMGVVPGTHSFPLAISIFDLMVLADIFSGDEAEFFKYLETRIPLYTETNLVVEDELDMLGFYFSRDFPKSMKAISRGQEIVVDSTYRQKLDTYFQSLYEGKSATPPKRPTN